MGMELKHAILGLLSIQPMSGYDLNRAFSNTVAHFWYADQSQIYRTLDKLTANKAITTKVIHQEGKPDRKVHSLTTTGRAELEDWLTSLSVKSRLSISCGPSRPLTYRRKT